MGLIREPKNVDFYVLDKPWTDEERKEFSAFIKLRKEQRKKRNSRATSTRRRKVLQVQVDPNLF
jgi:hypothetical protein